MKTTISKSTDEMGAAAAEIARQKLGTAIFERGVARLILSTGESQFAVLKHLCGKDLEWDKVEIFHLDEYIGLSISHPASFCRYLKERVVDIVHPGKMHYIDGEGDVSATIARVTTELRKAPIDIAFIGIGENAHIAFNDPPADFNTSEAYAVVTLNETCKMQQVSEGWFPTVDDVPNSAISMTVYQIMQSETIISCVPGQRKAIAVRETLSAPEVTNMIPATKLREHKDWYLFLDSESARLAEKDRASNRKI